MPEAREDWGVPDGLNMADYAGHETWTRQQWRWELIRRSQEARLHYQMAAIDAWRAGRAGGPIPEKLIWDRSHASISFPLGPAMQAKFGVRDLHNPLHPLASPEEPDIEARRILPWHFERIASGHLDYRELTGLTGVVMVFDPTGPIEAQIEGLREYLRKSRSHHQAPDPQRAHPEKWIGYLRILDARAAGHSWQTCADTIVGNHAAKTKETARAMHEAAIRLQGMMVHRPRRRRTFGQRVD